MMAPAQSDQSSSADSEHRPPLVPSDKNVNGVVPRKPKSRDVPSRYKSMPTLSSSSSSSHASPAVSLSSRRNLSPSPSPNVSRWPTMPEPKRSLSAEKRRPSTSASLTRPGTPGQDSKISNGVSDSRRNVVWSSESLWPTTRSLSVSFQADSYTLPASKRERLVNHSVDRTLMPNANRHSESLVTQQRKVTPEKKKTLSKSNGGDQHENARPSENGHARAIEQNRWPSNGMSIRNANPSARSTDFGNHKFGKDFRQFFTEDNMDREPRSVARRMSFDGAFDLLKMQWNNDQLCQSSSSPDSDAVNNASSSGLGSCDSSSGTDSISTCSDPTVDEEHFKSRSYNGGASARGIIIPARFLQDNMNKVHRSMSSRSEHDVSSFSLRPSGRKKHLSLNVGASFNSTERAPTNYRTSKSDPSSPNKVIYSSSPSRSLTSPSTKGSVITSLSSSPSHMNDTSAFLHYLAYVRKGKKGSSQKEEEHQLKLLHNRHLQWRFVNGKAAAAFAAQHATAEDVLYNAHMTTSDLRDSVTLKRSKLQELRQDVKLHLVLQEQMSYLDNWASLEKEHSSSLSGIVEALEACTVRLPITDGAKADIPALKESIISAVEVIQAMASSVSSYQSKVEGMHSLTSELADVTTQQKALIDECGELLETAAALQGEESSLKAHLIQLRQAGFHGKHSAAVEVA